MMQNQHVGTSGMDQDSLLAQDNTYGTPGWVGMNALSQNTMAGYDSFNYLPPATHGLSPDSSRMPPPPTLQPLQTQTHQTRQPSHPHSHSQMSLPMVRTNIPLPSQLLPGSSGSYSAPAGMPPPMPKSQPQPPAQTPSSPQVKPKAKAAARKALSNAERKEICELHENNPGIKQTEIGKLFGVERSTISKVLRQKEKYLGQDSRNQSPAKGGSTRDPDLDRALIRHISKEQQVGHRMSDEEMLEKARHLAQGLGKRWEAQLKAIDIGWIEKFKARSRLMPSRLTRRASETNITDRAMSIDSSSLTPPQASSGISPASPTGQPSPISGRSDEESNDPLSGFMSFSPDGANSGGGIGGYKHSNNQSTTSLSSFTDAAASSFSGSAMSPTAPFTFSPDANVGGFLPPASADQRGHPHHLAGGLGSNFQRPRSQTFPTLDIEHMNQPGTTEPQTPKFQPSVTAPSSALDSPMHEAPPYSFDTSVSASPGSLHRSGSSSSSMAARAAAGMAASGMAGGGLAGSGMGSAPVGSSPTSPTQDEARRGGEALLSYVEHTAGAADQNEYNAILRVIERMRLQHHQPVRTAGFVGSAGGIGSMGSLGSLTRIPEHDIDMPPVSMATKA